MAAFGNLLKGVLNIGSATATTSFKAGAATAPAIGKVASDEALDAVKASLKTGAKQSDGAAEAAAEAGAKAQTKTGTKAALALAGAAVITTGATLAGLAAERYNKNNGKLLHIKKVDSDGRLTFAEETDFSDKDKLYDFYNLICDPSLDGQTKDIGKVFSKTEVSINLNNTTCQAPAADTTCKLKTNYEDVLAAVSEEAGQTIADAGGKAAGTIADKLGITSVISKIGKIAFYSIVAIVVIIVLVISIKVIQIARSR